MLMLALCWVILHRRYGGAREVAGDVQAYAAAQRAKLGPWSRAQANVALVFALACTLWMLPGAIAVVSSPDAPIPRFFETHLPESTVALTAAVLLFGLPTNLRRGEFTLTWREAVRIDWGTILLFGGGLALGRLLFETGLAEIVESSARWAPTASGRSSRWPSSNTASASAIVPLVIAVAQGAGLSPVPPVLGAALGASFGFMLPVSTPPNAIVYGSGLVPLREMIVSGIWLDLSGAVLIWLGLRVQCPFFGLT